jgi:hypothetical protein
MKRRLIAMLLTVSMILGLTPTASAWGGPPPAVRAMCPGHEEGWDGWLNHCVFCSPFGFFLGDVDGNGEINAVDVLDILLYIARLDQTTLVTFANDTYTIVSPWGYAAADVNQDGVIDLLDVAELLTFLSNMPGIMNGNEPITIEKPPLTAVVNTNNINTTISPRSISIVTDIELQPTMLVFEYEVTIPHGVTRIREAVLNTDSKKLEGNVFDPRTNRYFAIITITESLPAGSVIISHRYDGVPNDIHDFEVIADNITEIRYVGCEIEGCCNNPPRSRGDVNGDGEIDIHDVMIILLHLAGFDTIISHNDFARDASLVRGGLRVPANEPTIRDALAILEMMLEDTT